MKSRILFFFSVIVLSLAACKKDPVNAVTIEHEKAADSLLNVNINESLVLSPKVSGKASSYQWLENEKEVSAAATYTFSKELPGVYTLVFKAVNAGGASTLTYKIKVLGPYGRGVLLLNSYNEEDKSELSFIDEKGVLTLNVFSKANKGIELAEMATNLYHYNNQFYITSTVGPNHITVIDDQTLKVNYTIAQKGISEAAYFATTDGKTGYLMAENSRGTGLFSVDLNHKSIATTALANTDEIPMIPVNHSGNSIITSSGEKLLKVDGNVVSVLNKYKENVSGVLKMADKSIWIGVQGFADQAKFIRLNENFKGVDSVLLDEKYKLPANGILTTSGADPYIYWQETGTGEFCRFNISTKKAEVFIDPAKGSVVYATAWKVNPANGDLYIADTPGLFSGKTESTLIITGQDGQQKNTIKKAGHVIMDIVFPR